MENLSFNKRISIVKKIVFEGLNQTKELDKIKDSKSVGFYSLNSIEKFLMPALYENDLDLDLEIFSDKIVGHWYDCISDKKRDIEIDFSRIVEVGKLQLMANIVMSEGAVKSYTRRYALTLILRLPSTDKIDNNNKQTIYLNQSQINQINEFNKNTIELALDKIKVNNIQSIPQDMFNHFIALLQKYNTLSQYQIDVINKYDNKIVDYIIKNSDYDSIHTIPQNKFEAFLKLIKQYENKKEEKENKKEEKENFTPNTKQFYTLANKCIGEEEIKKKIKEIFNVNSAKELNREQFTTIINGMNILIAADECNVKMNLITSYIETKFKKENIWELNNKEYNTILFDLKKQKQILDKNKSDLPIPKDNFAIPYKGVYGGVKK